jgi:hypothetical protein
MKNITSSTFIIDYIARSMTPHLKDETSIIIETIGTWGGAIWAGEDISDL